MRADGRGDRASAVRRAMTRSPSSPGVVGNDRKGERGRDDACTRLRGGHAGRQAGRHAGRGGEARSGAVA